MSRYIHVEVDRIIRETDKAFLVEIDGEEHWLPKSQVADADDYDAGDEGCTMSITEFIANEKGLS